MIKEFIGGFKEGQKLFGKTIAVIVNTILLSIIYFIGIGLTSIVAKLFGKHFLELEKKESLSSYWSELNLGKKPIKEYYRQF